MTTTEEVIRLTREVADASLNDPVVGSSIVLDIGEMKRLIELIKAEENEACAKVCDELHYEWNFGEISGPRQCAESIRARRK